MATVIDTAVEYSMCDGCSSHLAESFAPPTAGGPAAACRLCRLPILERFFLQIDNDSWHESCAQCSCCHVQLEQACFVKNRQLFCRDDYYRLFLPKCADCKDTIMIGEYVMHAMNSTYHLRCFNCTVCRQPLRKGDLFLLPNDTGKLICKTDFDREHVAKQAKSPISGTLNQSDSCYGTMLSCYSNEHDRESVEGYGYFRNHATGTNSILDSESELAPDGTHHRALGGALSSGGKRPRTILTMTQRRKFKQAFEVNPKPSRKIRESLAADTGLTVRVVQVWFQNQRAKVKKLARRHASLGHKATDTSHKKASGNAANGASSSDDHSSGAPVNASFDTIVDSNDQLDSSDTDSIASSNCLNNNSASTENSATYQSDCIQNVSANPNNPSANSTLKVNNNSTCNNGNSKSSNPIGQLYSIQNKYFG